MLPGLDDKGPPSWEGGSSEKQFLILLELLLERNTNPVRQLQTLPAVINHAHVRHQTSKQRMKPAVRLLWQQDIDNQLTLTANETPVNSSFDKDDPPPPYPESASQVNLAPSQRNAI